MESAAVWVDKDEYFLRLRQAIGTYYWDIVDTSGGSWAGYEEFFNGQLNTSKDDSNLSRATPFIGDNGELYSVVTLANLAGPAEHDEVFNLENYELNANWNNYLEVAEDNIDSVEKAFACVKEYLENCGEWGRYQNDSYFTMWCENSETAENDGYYIRGLDDMPTHMSTLFQYEVYPDGRIRDTIFNEWLVG